VRLGVRFIAGYGWRAGWPAERRSNSDRLIRCRGFSSICMERYIRFYIATVITAAIGLVAVSFNMSDLDALSGDDWKLVASLITVALLSQAAAIDFGKGRQASSSVAFIPFLATAIMFPASVGMLIAGTVIGISELVFTRRDAAKRSFNVAQVVLAVGLSAHVYTYLLGGDARSEVFLL